MVLLDVALALTYMFLCVRGPEALLHVFTWGITVASMAGAFTEAVHGTSDEWGWFGWAKRASLMVGWLALFCGWQGAFRGEKWPCAHMVARRFVQIVLMGNVGEAAVLMLVAENYVGGIICFMLALVSPDWSAVDEQGRLVCDAEVSSLGLQAPFAPVSSRWYFRCYYVVLSFPLCLHPFFAEMWVLVYITCLWPLLYQEVIAPQLNAGIIFKTRAFMLIAVAFIDTFIDQDALERSTPVSHPDVGSSLLAVNGISAAVIAFFLAAFLLLDALRPCCVKEVVQEPLP